MPELMVGFPPEADAQVTLANWRTAPFCHWAFHHVREIIPTANIRCGAARAEPFATEVTDLSGVSVMGTDGQPIDWDGYLKATSTDAVVVLKSGKVVFEHYANGMTPQDPHILMSVSKSMLGLLAGILVDRGVLDLEAALERYLPEVRGTAFEGASIRQLLDMRVGISFNEDYLATGGPIIAYRKSTNWNPLQPGETETDLRSFFRTLKDGDRQHGGPFNYVSPCTDLMGWVIERAAGARFADLFSELIWQPMGAEVDAYITVDRLGAPRCAGGLNMTVRDLARVGRMVAQNGAGALGGQVVPEAWIHDIATGGDRAAWVAGNFHEHYPGADMHYRSKWYIEHRDTPLVFAMGIHGQHLFVDPAGDFVVAKVSSYPVPLVPELKDMTLRAVRALQSLYG